jgi:hypothetical protein
MKKTSQVSINNALLFLLIAFTCDVFGMEKEIQTISRTKEKEYQKKRKTMIIQHAQEKEINSIQKSRSMQSFDLSARQKDQQILFTPRAKQKEPKHKKNETDEIDNESIEKELGLCVTLVQKTPYNLWLAIHNKTKRPFETPVTVEVRNTQKCLIKKIFIRPEKKSLKYFNFEAITHALSLFKVRIYDERRKLLLKLMAFRYKNSNMPPILEVLLQDKSKIFDKRTIYDETENNYLITVDLDQHETLYTAHAKIKKEEDRKERKNLKVVLDKAIEVNGDLKGSFLFVQPAPQELLEKEKLKAIKKKKNESLIKRFEKTSSEILAKTIQKNNL